MPLKNLIISEVKKNGFITVSRFMEFCLYHKKFGYYASKKLKIGALGDFVTAPEISQVFGELIGLWLAQVWTDQGKPEPFSLVELGPGNGTMMNDMLRTLRKVPRFLNSASIVLVENSQTLKVRQKHTLKDYRATWVENVADIPEQPLFLVANEFLDSLPSRQFSKKNNIWFERAVTLNSMDELEFVYIPSTFSTELDFLYQGIPNNVVVEISDIAKDVLSNISDKIIENSGVGLFIDYGFFEGYGETLQAVFEHSYSDPLQNLGETDLTMQVNFKNAYKLFKKKGLRPSNLENQGTFLKNLGIKVRADFLAKKMSESKKRIHLSAINRLIDTNQMGALFKVMGVTRNGSPLLPLLEK